MTIYYVRKTGDDGNAGTSASAAWLTIDKAASTMQAGDTVYIGAGTYKELVTIDYSGSLGSLISYIADIDGSKTGDSGLVFVTAHDTASDVATRNNCLVLVDKTHLFFQDICFVGGLDTNGPVYFSCTTSASYDCVEMNGCSIIRTGDALYSRALTINYKLGAAPTTIGLRLNYCVVIGGTSIRFAEQATATVDVDFLAYKCIFEEGSAETASSIIRFARDVDSTYALSGFVFDSCEFVGAQYAVYTNNLGSLASSVLVKRSIFRGIGGYYGYGNSSYNLVFENNFIYCYDTSLYVTFTGLNRTGYIGRVMGGLVDLPLYRKFGYSPYKPRENIAFVETKPLASLIDSPDIYGDSLGAGGEIEFLITGELTDPDSVWTNESNIIDDSTSTYGSTSTVGSGSSNYVQVVIDYPYDDDQIEDAVIESLQFRFIAYASNSSVSLSGDIYTSGRTSLIASIDETFLSTSTLRYLVDLDVPEGLKLSDLNNAELRIWKNAGSSSYVMRVYYIYMVATVAISSSVGPVNDRNRAIKNTSVKHSGSSSICISGSGYQEFFIPVNAESNTLSVYAQYDSNYVESTGYLPKLEVFNILGANDVSDEMTASANTWEQLSVTFTPTSTGIVRVRLSSFDVSGVGKAYFDDVSRS